VLKQLRRLSSKILDRLGDRYGFDVVRRQMYTALPELPPPDSPIWNRPGRLGFELDLARQLDFVELALRPYIAEFTPPADPGDSEDAFYLWNSLYAGADATLLYAMVRHLRPPRLLELGSGQSTLVSAQACAANARDGSPTELICVDPEPRIELEFERFGIGRIERKLASALPLERYLALERGDVLFVDTTHTVKLGGEVNFLVLDVLPRLRPGVIVHFHDIFLPYEYPREWFEWGWSLAEQYLLHAFLIGNADWEVLLSVHAVFREQGARLAEAIPALKAAPPRGYAHPAAFWIRRC
jgi:methyltransferase family protein